MLICSKYIILQISRLVQPGKIYHIFSFLLIFLCYMYLLFTSFMKPFSIMARLFLNQQGFSYDIELQIRNVEWPTMLQTTECK